MTAWSVGAQNAAKRRADLLLGRAALAQMRLAPA
jgi:hypothetical protein